MPGEIASIETGSNNPDGTNVTFGYVGENPVEREEAYAISSSDLNKLGRLAQKVEATNSLFTLKDIIYIFSGQFDMESTASAALYNGVRLPIISEDVLAQYPYAWIRKNNTSGYYDLFLATSPWHWTGSVVNFSTGHSGTWYRLNISDANTAQAWEFNQNLQAGNMGIDDDRTLLWSNHDIEYLGTSSVYFYGSQPSPTE
jgi:hypothetical protein